MTLLSIVQGAAAALGVTEPATVIGNQNQDVAQLLALANHEGRHLVLRAGFSALREEAAHTSIASEDQGAIEDIAPGFSRLVPKTFWDRTNQWEMVGPVSAEDWQYVKARGIEPSVTHFAIRGRRLIVHPAPAAGLSWAFEYYSNRWIAAEDGTRRARFAADNDAPVLDAAVVELGVVWRWLKAKGLDYSEEKRDYEVALANYRMNDERRDVEIGVGRRSPARGEFRAIGVA